MGKNKGKGGGSMQDRFEAFTLLIAGINRSIRRIKTEEMAEFDLKSPHVSCLYYLYKEGALTLKALGDICDEDKAALSRSIDYLEKRGYVTLNNKKGMRYKAEISLSETGREVAGKVVRKIDGFLKDVGVSLGEEGRAALYSGLRTVNRDLEKICEKYDK